VKFVREFFDCIDAASSDVEFEQIITFGCLSSLLTWAKNKHQLLKSSRSSESSDVGIPSLSNTIAEVAAASVLFKNGKAAGLDGIQVELIKLRGIAEELTPMLNAIYVSGNAPEAFCRAAIVPIPKKGDLSQLGNWRGIRLMSLLAKLYTHVLLNHLRTLLDPLLCKN